MVTRAPLTRPSQGRVLRSACAALTVLLLAQSSSSGAEPPGVVPAHSGNQKVRIAVVQQETTPGAVKANRAKAIRFAREALRGGADVILFHEALLVGYVPHIHKLAETVDGPSTRAYANLDCTLLLWLNNRGSRFPRRR